MLKEQKMYDWPSVYWTAAIKWHVSKAGRLPRRQQYRKDPEFLESVYFSGFAVGKYYYWTHFFSVVLSAFLFAVTKLCKPLDKNIKMIFSKGACRLGWGECLTGKMNKHDMNEHVSYHMSQRNVIKFSLTSIRYLKHKVIIRYVWW